jgi:hypothetical protein
LKLFLIATLALGAGLPELKIPEKWRACQQDSDCAIAGDACRSCGKVTVIHKKYLKDYLSLDQKEREKAGFNPACEACFRGDIRVVCKSKVCGAQVEKK